MSDSLHEELQQVGLCTVVVGMRVAGSRGCVCGEQILSRSGYWSAHHSWLCKWMAERFSKHLIEYGLASSISTSPVHAGQAGQATCLLSKNCAAGVG